MERRKEKSEKMRQRNKQNNVYFNVVPALLVFCRTFLSLPPSPFFLPAFSFLCWYIRRNFLFSVIHFSSSSSFSLILLPSLSGWNVSALSSKEIDNVPLPFHDSSLPLTLSLILFLSHSISSFTLMSFLTFNSGRLTGCLWIFSLCEYCESLKKVNGFTQSEKAKWREEERERWWHAYMFTGYWDWLWDFYHLLPPSCLWGIYFYILNFNLDLYRSRFVNFSFFFLLHHRGIHGIWGLRREKMYCGWTFFF